MRSEVLREAWTERAGADVTITQWGTTTEEDVMMGVAWLDEESPGWALKVDLSTFDIIHARKCILAQVFEEGTWLEMYDERGAIWIGDHGFATGQMIWETIIRERQEVA